MCLVAFTYPWTLPVKNQVNAVTSWRIEKSIIITVPLRLTLPTTILLVFCQRTNSWQIHVFLLDNHQSRFILIYNTGAIIPYSQFFFINYFYIQTNHFEKLIQKNWIHFSIRHTSDEPDSVTTKVPAFRIGEILNFKSECQIQ